MSPGATFERVYRALKSELGSGRFAAGEHLEPANLSLDLNASITPVRDALHRLAGEGLVETPRGDGFRTPLVTEVALRQLYRWHSALLHLAVGARAKDRRREPAPEAGADPLEWMERLFAAIGGVSGNPEHEAAIVRIGERLRPARRLEFELISDWNLELGALDRADRPPDLRRAIAAYHRRRERLAPEIVAKLHEPRR